MLTIERMYALAHTVAQKAPTHPACDHEDLVQCAVLGMLEARVPDEALAAVIARRRIIDEIRHHRGRRRRVQQPGRAAVHEASYLYRPLHGNAASRLADVLPADDESLTRIENRVDAEREAPPLLRAIGRRAKHILVWHVVQERSLAEIASRCGVTESRISQITREAVNRARAVDSARGRRIAPVPSPSRRHRGNDAWFDATSSEKRAFGEFRRLQRAGLRRQEALAVLSEAQQLLVAEYQRKCQRRARARAALAQAS